MRNSALALAVGGLALYVAAATVLAGHTVIHSKHEYAPRMDVYAPPACEEILHKVVPDPRIDVTVNMDTYIRLRDQLLKCGGRVVPEE